MSGALNSVFGGGGIGAMVNIAAMVFPPAGMAMSIANIASQAIGAAVNEAAKQLQQESGMPKFLQDIIGKVVEEVLGKNSKETDPACDAHANGNSEVQDWKRDFVQQLREQMVDMVKDEVQSEGSKGTGKGGGKGGGGSWLVALARALGEVAGAKAQKMVELSDKLTGLQGKDQAQESVATQSELNGVSKEFAQFMETINNVVKGIGDGLTTVARKG